MLVRNNASFLKWLKRESAKKRNQLIRDATKEEILSLCEVSKNILAGRIPLHKLGRLKRYRCAL